MLVWALTTVPLVAVSSPAVAEVPVAAGLSFDVGAVAVESGVVWAASAAPVVDVELAELELDDAVEVSSAAATP